MKITLVIPPDRTDELISLLSKDYDFTITRDKADIIVSSNLKDREEIWKLNCELMDKYKITGTIIHYG